MITLRREFTRFEVNGQASLFDDTKQNQVCILKDISSRGAGIIGYKQLDISSYVTIKFTIPFLSEGFIQRKARAVWSRKVDENLWESGLDFGFANMLELVKLQ